MANTPRPAAADRKFAPILGWMAQIRGEDDAANPCSIRGHIPGMSTFPPSVTDSPRELSKIKTSAWRSFPMLISRNTTV